MPGLAIPTSVGTGAYRRLAQMSANISHERGGAGGVALSHRGTGCR
jgi:hypothetical protein